MYQWKIQKKGNLGHLSRINCRVLENSANIYIFEANDQLWESEIFFSMLKCLEIHLQILTSQSGDRAAYAICVIGGMACLPQLITNPLSQNIFSIHMSLVEDLLQPPLSKICIRRTQQSKWLEVPES